MANILIIDDDEVLLSALARYLQIEGHTVTVTADGPPGIEIVRKGSPDVVLLDLGLPTMSGLTVLKELMQIDPQLKVVMISGYLSPKDIQEAMDIGAFAVVEKATRLEELSGMVLSAIKSGQSEILDGGGDGGKVRRSENPAPVGKVHSLLHASVGALGIGTWSWGDRGWGYGVTHTERDIHDAFTECIGAGLNFFDTAESYGSGEAEKILGRCLRSCGAEVKIATKFSAARWEVRRKHAVNACRRSLERLGIPQIELYQIHWPSRFASVEQRMDALAEIVEKGMARYVGVSNYSFDQIRRAQEHLSRRNIKLASVQLEFNVLYPQPETNGILRYCLEEGIMFIAYSPLAMGVLTGKYNVSNPIPGERRHKFPTAMVAHLQQVMQLLGDIGKRHGNKTIAQVAINWVLCKGALPIVGVKNRIQAEENIGGAGWSLSPEEVRAIDGLDRAWIR